MCAQRLDTSKHRWILLLDLEKSVHQLSRSKNTTEVRPLGHNGGTWSECEMLNCWWCRQHQIQSPAHQLIQHITTRVGATLEQQNDTFWYYSLLWKPTCTSQVDLYRQKFLQSHDPPQKIWPLVSKQTLTVSCCSQVVVDFVGFGSLVSTHVLFRL